MQHLFRQADVSAAIGLFMLRPKFGSGRNGLHLRGPDLAPEEMAYIYAAQFWSVQMFGAL